MLPTPLPLAPAWPRIGQARLDRILYRSQDRMPELRAEILKYMKLDWFLRAVLGSVWSGDVVGGASKRFARTMRAKVMHQRTRRLPQLEGSRVLSGDPPLASAHNVRTASDHV